MKAYVHYRNHKVYRVVNQRTMIQEHGVWVPAVLYTPLEHPELHFVRSKAEFDEKFMQIDLPDVAVPREFDPANN